MNQKTIKQLMLYRYRYYLVPLLFTLLMGALLTVEIGSVPAGLSKAEVASAVTSSRMEVGLGETVINMPYHVLQRLSIEVFGLSQLAIKLPSLILGAVGGIGIFMLLRRWFKPNVASIAAFFAITNGLFLMAGRTGEPTVMLVLWSVYLLLIATLIAQGAKGQLFWRSVMGAVVGLSLYTPLSIYVIIAGVVAGFLHPHVRFILRRYGKLATSFATILFAATAFPLLYGLWLKPGLILDLLGVPDKLPTIAGFFGQLYEAAVHVGGFMSPEIATTVLPAFSIASIVLMGFGLYRVLKDHHATRTYTLLLWLAIIIPVIGLMPDNLIILFVPVVLLIAVGIQTLIREWYRIFPLNPYARLLGLVPLILLVTGLTYLNYTTYFNGMRYGETTAQEYSSDLRLLTNTLRDDYIKLDNVTIAVNHEEIALYRQIELPNGGKLKVLTDEQLVETLKKGTPKGTLIISEPIKIDRQPLGVSDRLVVNDRASDALRWRVYVD